MSTNWGQHAVAVDIAHCISLGLKPITYGGSTGFFGGWYLPRLSINYGGLSKDMEKRLPQLYYIKMKISYDLGFITIGVAMAT